MPGDFDDLQFNWIWKVPDQRKTKQPDIISPDEFDSLIQRIDCIKTDPLVAARNQAMLWMTYGSCFRAVEVARWKVKEALNEDGSLVRLARLRAEATKGAYPAIAPIVIDEQRTYVNEWLNLRVKHKIKMGPDPDKYRGLDPESHVFLSFHYGRWAHFSSTRKISKGKEYFVATTVQNLLTRLYKYFGHPGCSSHTGRHSMARLTQTLLKKKGLESDTVVQNLLHHRDIESQKDYTDVDWLHIKKCQQAMLPKPKKRGPKPKNDKQ